MAATLTLPAPGTLGTNAGANSDGCLVGSLAATALSKGLLEAHALACLCITDDGGLYVNETTEANEGTADDVEIVGTTMAADDAIYFGHATVAFEAVNIVISTQGDYTDPVIAWEYWDGSAWSALADVVDGTTMWEAAAGTVVVSFTVPTDWAKNTVDGVLAYWVRANVTSVTLSVTPAQLEQAWVIAPAGSGTFTDDTTDINDAGTADVALLPAAQPVVNDAFYFGHLTEKFCKIKLVTSTAITGTQTMVWEYWDGDSWETIAAPIEDKSAGYATAAGTHMVSFEPPQDWTICTAANGPDGNAGYFVRCRMSAFTSVTADPVATQAWVYPLTTGAAGVPSPVAGTASELTMTAMTASAANNDSRFLLINATRGTFEEFTWTQAVAAMSAASTFYVAVGDEIVVAQIQEDGTTEFAAAAFYLTV